tara:strand:- start:154 stop:369 length:216 start_codon:yes stop_codon:yes gene_type:complete
MASIIIFSILFPSLLFSDFKYAGVFHNVLHKLVLFCGKPLIVSVNLALLRCFERILSAILMEKQNEKNSWF